MNNTFEKAFKCLSDEEQAAIIRKYGGNINTAIDCKISRKTGAESPELIATALLKLFNTLRDRADGDLNALSSFEERVLAKAVASGDAGSQQYYHR